MRVKIREYLAWKSLYAPTAADRYKYVLADVDKLNSIHDITRLKTKWDSKYAPSHVAYRVAVLKNFISFLKEKNLTDLSPNLLKIPRFTPRRRIVASKDDVTKMLDIWSESSFLELRNKLIIAFLFDTGVRVSELVGLNLRDIEQQFALIQTKKALREDTIKWGAETQRLLLKYLGVRITIDGGEHLFVSMNKKFGRITTRQIERILEESSKRAGLEKKLTPHTLRHGFAHLKLKMGANIKELQTMLRHSERNPQAAFQYLMLTQNEQKGIWDKYV